MAPGKEWEDITLIDVLIDGFEKNEILRGYHWRDLPMPNPDAASRKFASFVDEAQRWKGPPTKTLEEHDRRLCAWSDLEIRKAGRAIMVRVKAPWFSQWWHNRETWEGEPMAPIYDWITEEESSA